MIHELKITPELFNDVFYNGRNFLIRRFDQDFQLGDIVKLSEWYKGNFTQRATARRITYILRGDGSYGLSPDYCILSIVELANWEKGKLTDEELSLIRGCDANF